MTLRKERLARDGSVCVPVAAGQPLDRTMPALSLFSLMAFPFRPPHILSLFPSVFSPPNIFVILPLCLPGWEFADILFFRLDWLCA